MIQKPTWGERLTRSCRGRLWAFEWRFILLREKRRKRQRLPFHMRVRAKWFDAEKTPAPAPERLLFIAAAGRL